MKWRSPKKAQWNIQKVSCGPASVPSKLSLFFYPGSYPLVIVVKSLNKPENSTDSVHAFSQLCLHVANVLHDKFAHISKMTLLKASLKSIIRYCINISNIGFVNILFGGGSCSDIQWQYLRPLHPRPWPKSQLSIKDRIKIIHINHIQKICCIKKIYI